MRRGFIVTAFGAALAWLSVGVAAAAPLGTLAITACSGQGVTVTANVIDWLPAGGGVGCISTVQPTNVAYAGGVLGPGVTGSIADLVAPAPPPTIAPFMAFAGHPNLLFDLTSIGPGVASTACVNTFNAADPVCSIIAGSPFVLRPGAGGTTVTLAAFGIARDGSGVDGLWQGTFSVDFAGETPAAVQARFFQTGSITSGHSGSFVVTAQPVVPEPASLMLLGTGLIGAAMRARKGLRRREK